MRIIRYRSANKTYLGTLEGETVTPLRQEDGEPFTNFISLIRKAHGKGSSLKEYLQGRIKSGGAKVERFTFKDLYEAKRGGLRLLSPLDPPEAWGCGVTYRRSVEAREFETKTKGVYDLLYEAERPGIFFKGTPRNCAGPNHVICVRGDSKWTVPESELTFITGMEEEIVGFTAGNDVSSRDIEGQNPLYNPPAKIYNCSCSLGPSIVTADEVGSEPKLGIELKIHRAGSLIFQGSTHTSKMKRNMEELRSYLCRYNSVPVGTACLTGTGIVPPDDFSLMDKDVVEITIEKIGTLRNPVKQL